LSVLKCKVYLSLSIIRSGKQDVFERLFPITLTKTGKSKIALTVKEILDEEIAMKLA